MSRSVLRITQEIEQALREQHLILLWLDTNYVLILEPDSFLARSNSGTSNFVSTSGRGNLRRISFLFGAFKMRTINF